MPYVEGWRNAILLNKKKKKSLKEKKSLAKLQMETVLQKYNLKRLSKNILLHHEEQKTTDDASLRRFPYVSQVI